MAKRVLIFVIVLVLGASLRLLPVAAQTASLFATGGGAQPLVARQTGIIDHTQTHRRHAGSLFSGQEVGLFAPIRRVAPGASWGAYQGNVARLRDIIAKAEAGPLGYDAVQYGAIIKPAKAPTEMTLAEIFQWIKDTPGQPHAIGRYQFIPKTLAYLVKKEGVPMTAQFSPALQDRLADILLDQAGMQEFLIGNKDRTAFMNSLAKVWAGLPTSSGKSYYHGHAGNKATMTWSSFETKMAQAFPGA